MAKQAKAEEVVLERMTGAHLGPVFEVTLDSIKVDPARFRHRADADLGEKKGSMKDLMKNLTTEGQKDPLIVYKGADGQCHLVGGHRRRWAMQLLAEAKTKGFTADMPVKVREILDGDPADYLVMSVADNLFQERIDELHRTKAAVCLIEEGIDDVRIKVNLKLSDSTFDRCRRLAANRWMLKHVDRGEIGLTDAHSLLEAAGGNGGQDAVDDLRRDLASEVAVVARAIEAEKQELAARNKEIKAADAIVKNQFPSYLVKGWVQALRRGERIRRDVKFVYGAAIEKDKFGRKLVIPAISGIYLVEPELERLAEITRVLDGVVKNLRPLVNSLARQRIDAGGREEAVGPADYQGAGLDDVAEALGLAKPAEKAAGPKSDAAYPGAAGGRGRRHVSATGGLAIADEQPEGEDEADDDQ